MNARSPEMDGFVEEARSVSITTAFERCGHSLSTLRRAGVEYVGACPACGGRDRFQLNPQKNVFLCRQGEQGDAIALVQYLTGESFLDACETLTGRERPGPSKSENELRGAAQRQREAAEKRAAQLAVSAEDARRQEEDSAFFRRRELAKCLDLWNEAVPLPGSLAERYLALRGLDPSRIDPAYLRCHPSATFWGRNAQEKIVPLHRGPVLVGVLVVPQAGTAKIIGIHQTWIDLDARASKFRPRIADPLNECSFLPSKKMRGSKAGGMIPLVGRLSSARRMVAGEGIETVLAFGAREGFPDGTFYCAAGDLGNLCGKATKESRFRHPTETSVDRAGRRRAVWVQGQEPDLGSLAVPVPDHIDELVLVGDGDSEPVMTRAAMKRGARRHDREGRAVSVAMAPAGTDFAELAMENAA